MNLAFPFVILLIALPVISLGINYLITRYATKHGMQERDEEKKQLDARVNNKIAEVELSSGQPATQKQKNEFYNQEIKRMKMNSKGLFSLSPEKEEIPSL